MKASLAGYSNLVWQLFSEKIALTTSFHDFLDLNVSVEKSSLFL
jgi:hypothetical protein